MSESNKTKYGVRLLLFCCHLFLKHDSSGLERKSRFGRQFLGVEHLLFITPTNLRWRRIDEDMKAENINLYAAFKQQQQ